jgi:glycerol-3-phosphate acyltransferase PlsX
VLVGVADRLAAELEKLAPLKNISVRTASEVISMEDDPVKAVRSKSGSSVSVGLSMVKEGSAQAFVSAGNTGAVMSAALLILGRVKGINRPAIATIMPAFNRRVILLDSGANLECKPENLLQFAKMADVYARFVLNVAKPSVGLLNIGEEEGKGNELMKTAYDLLASSNLNFSGNIEGHDILAGKTDIVVCDGFTGNIVLKVLEGAASYFRARLKHAFNGGFMTKVGALLVTPALKKMERKIDPEEYGGAQLLGVNGVCIICHGRSSAKAIKNALVVAEKAAAEQVVSKIAGSFEGALV